MCRSRPLRLAMAALATLVAAGLLPACHARVGDSSGASSPAPPRAQSRGQSTVPAEAPRALPMVTPRPQRIWRAAPDVAVPDDVTVHVTRKVGRPTRKLLTHVLGAAGALRVRVLDMHQHARDQDTLTVLAGSITDERISGALRKAGAFPRRALPAQGYALAVHAGTVVLGGADADGTYYAAQTLRQLVRDGHLAGAAAVDFPDMSARGTIEGFYGKPWSHAERMAQLAFSGRLKLNEYVYTPKDDPYLRARWREKYPPERLAQLRELVSQARTHHVSFTYAVSPGQSICFSDEDDVHALEAKLASLYDIGVRDFAVPFDDISYDQWNCAADRRSYGAPSPAAAGRAQATLLNAVWRDFATPHDASLLSVPTEYHDLADSGYKRAIRSTLDPDIGLMWTGPAVVPAEITKAQASKADRLWGRKVVLWDNYATNDYDITEGRLFLAPYDNRADGLSTQLAGDLLNPMNQAGASKVVLFGLAGYSWNDTGYRPRRAWHAAAEYLAGGDEATTRALLAFFDTEHYAATSLNSGEAAQPQAPVLAARIATFDKQWSGGDRTAAIAELRRYATLLAGAPTTIRAGVDDETFLADCRPWLDALSLWGKAFQTTLDGLRAGVNGDLGRARRLFDRSATLAHKASVIRTVPGKTKPQGPVKVADGVLDEFLAKAPGLVM